MASPAVAYGGPPKLTLARAFTEWRADIPMLAVILLLAAWEAARAARASGGPARLPSPAHPPAQTRPPALPSR